MAARALALAVLLSLCLACGQPVPQSLVLVSLDTVRRDHLTTYGYARDTAPRLEALARSSVVFDNAFAQHVNTHPSHASMFTGLYPNVHGSIYNGMRLPAERITLAQVLAAAGFRTGAFVSGATLVAQTGLDRGFDRYDDDLPGARRDGRETVQRARAWLRERSPDQRFFLFVHLFDAHGPYEPHGPRLFRSSEPGPALERIPPYQRVRDPSGEVVTDLHDYVDRYDTMIHYSDALLGELLEGVDLERTLVVVLSDHGETLDERYHGLDHGGQTTDEQIRIPLVVHAPGLAPRRVEDFVETVDLVPTLLELLEVEPPGALAVQGRSLVPLLEGRRAEASDGVYASAVALEPRHADRGYRFQEGGQIHALRTSRWKLVLYPGAEGEVVELYDLERDPGERENRAAAEPEVREAQLAKLRRWMAQGPASSAPAEISPELRSYLRSLGYAEPSP